MSKLTAYRLRYTVTEICDVEIEGSSPQQAIEHLRGLLDIGPLAVETSRTVSCEYSIAPPVEPGGAS